MIELGRFSEAERLLLLAYEGLRAAGPQQMQPARRALEQLIQLYAFWNRNDKADAYRVQLVALGDTPAK